MQFLIKKTPDGFIKSVNEEISSILNRNFDSLFPEYIFSEELNKYAMPIEIEEKDNEFLIKAELPGIKKEDLDIDIDKNHLTVNAKKHEEKEINRKNYRKSEFKYGEFSRTVYFPQEINVEKTDAKLEHGVLRVVTPKLEEEKKDKKKLTVK